MKFFLLQSIVFTAIIISLVPFRVFAVGPGAPGDKCEHSEDCGLGMGCRESEINDYKICKISLPGTSGCNKPSNEALCADDMVCIDNECRLTFGFDKKENTEPSKKEERDGFSIKLEAVWQGAASSFEKFFSFLAALPRKITLQFFKKAYAVILAVGGVSSISMVRPFRVAMGKLSEKNFEIFFLNFLNFFSD